MKLLLELKTTSEDCSPGSPYWKRLTLDNQVSMYIAAARELGHDVAGVLYDVVRKTALRPTGKGTETPESYESRIVAQIAEAPDRYYNRGVIVRTSDEILEHEADVWQTADLIRLAKNSNRWPRYVGSCMLYNSPCDYWGVCSGETTIESDHYVTRASDRSLPVLSHSAINTWRQCPRKYYYAYELRRRRAGEDREVLRFGKLIHKAIEMYAAGGIDAALAQCVAEDKHMQAHARALVRGYHARWADSPVRIIATEQRFSRPLRNPDTGGVSRTFELGGVVDAVCEQK